MKHPKFSILTLFVLLISCSQTHLLSKKDTFTYFFRQSRYGFEKCKKWSELENDTVVYTMPYFRGSCCGDLPRPDLMKAKIVKDTLYYDYGNYPIPDCDSSIGICGIIVDFVINKRKYPNYRKLHWKFEPTRHREN